METLNIRQVRQRLNKKLLQETIVIKSDDEIVGYFVPPSHISLLGQKLDYVIDKLDILFKHIGIKE